MNSGKSPFVHVLTTASKEVLDEHIKKALNSNGLDVKLEKITKEKEGLENLLKEENLSQKERNNAEDLLKTLKDDIVAEKKKVREVEAKEREKQAQEAAKGNSVGNAKEKVKSNGGCFPGSSTFVDRWGWRKEMHSLQIGEKVQVVSNGSIYLEPVISFIHREQEKLQEFLSITTTNNRNLKITEDHLLFVEKNGLPQAIPARGVKIGDKVYVKQNELIGTGTDKDISIVYEKGVYAPVTSSGTILINDVHTSCYFDVLSHEWSHRAMGFVRAVYHVSPWMLQWISSVGEKDGFPGWGRLAHKMLTFMD